VELVVGRVGRAHGVRGEVAVEVRTDDPDRRFAAGALLRTDPVGAGPLTVSSARPHSGRLLVSFAEVPDRTAAEGLRGVLLTAEVADTDTSALEPEEFYDHQLVGMRVHDHRGALVGEVHEVLHHPAHEVLVVRRSSGGPGGHGGSGGDVMVPFVAELVPEVDLVAGHLTVADRRGLLDPELME
jgi:16S rRNA processing protein RimM